MKKKILFTKQIPLQENSFLEKFFYINYKNFIKTQFIYPNQNPIYNDIIITSSTSVDNLIKLYDINNLKSKNYYLVGETSEKKLKKITNNIILVKENAKELAKFLIKIPKKKFVYFGSNIRLPIIEKLLYENGKIIQHINLYKTILNPIKINEFYDAIVFMSPSAVKAFFILNKKIPSKTYIFALGKTTALSFYMHSKSLNHLVIIPNKSNVNELINCIKKINSYNH